MGTQESSRLAGTVVGRRLDNVFEIKESGTLKLSCAPAYWNAASTREKWASDPPPALFFFHKSISRFRMTETKMVRC